MSELETWYIEQPKLIQTLSECKGKKVSLVAETDDAVRLSFTDGSSIVLRARAAFDGYGEINAADYLSPYEMQELEFITEDELKAHIKAYNECQQKRQVEYRRQQYEALKKEFEGR